MGNVLIDVSFDELLTKALVEQKTQYITRVPRCLLTPIQVKYVAFIQACLDKHTIPTIDTFRKANRFLPQDSEVDIDWMYECYTTARRNEWLAESMESFMEKNVSEHRSPYEGYVAEQRRLYEMSIVPDPTVIDYKRLNREELDVNVYRTSFWLEEFDRMTNGLNGGDLIVLMAGTKGLKTTLLKKFAELAFWKGKENVIFASQEQSTLAMAAQFDAQYTNTAHGSLRQGISREQMERFHLVQERMAQMPNEFFITPKVSSVEQLHEYSVSQNVEFKRYFIDGLNLMKGGTGEEAHVTLERTCDKLKDYAVKNNAVVIAVTQANRTGYTAGASLGAQHLASAFAIAMYADLLIALSPQNDNGHDWTFCKPALNRHGGVNVKLGIEAVYNDDKYKLVINTLPDDFELDQSNMRAAAKTSINTQLTKIGLDVEEMQQKLSADASVDINAMMDMAVDEEQRELY